MAEDVCPDGRQIVDWFHAVHHLVDAAAALYPNETDDQKRSQWLKTYKEPLYIGRIHRIMVALHRRRRDDLAGYFAGHHRRMPYLEFRDEGFPIGSGTVESGVKQFKQRFTGIRWNPDNAHRMLIIRAAVLGNDFRALWASAA